MNWLLRFQVRCVVPKFVTRNLTTTVRLSKMTVRIVGKVEEIETLIAMLEGRNTWAQNFRLYHDQGEAARYREGGRVSFRRMTFVPHLRTPSRENVLPSKTEHSRSWFESKKLSVLEPNVSSSSCSDQLSVNGGESAGSYVCTVCTKYPRSEAP